MSVAMLIVCCMLVGFVPAGVFAAQAAETEAKSEATLFTSATTDYRSAEDVWQTLASYCATAYSLAYDYAKANGYIDAAVSALGGAIDLLRPYAADAVEAKDALLSLIDTLEKAQTLLSDTTTFDDALVSELESLMDTAEAAFNTLRDIKAELSLSGMFADVRDAAKIVAKKAMEYLKDKAAELVDAMIDSICATAQRLTPDLADNLRHYLEAAREKVAQLGATVAPHVKALLKNYGQEALLLTAYALSVGGVKVLDLIIADNGALINKIMTVVGVYGTETDALDLMEAVVKFLDPCNTIREKIDEIEEIVDDLQEKLNHKKAELESRIADLQEQLAGLSPEAAGEVNDEIAELEAQIADYEAQLDSLEDQLDSLKTQLDKSVNAINSLKAKLKALISSGLDRVDELKPALADLTAALKDLLQAVQGISTADIGDVGDKLHNVYTELNELVDGGLTPIVAALKDTFNSIKTKIENAAYNATHLNVSCSVNYYIYSGNYAAELASADDATAPRLVFVDSANDADVISVQMTANEIAYAIAEVAYSIYMGTGTESHDWSELINTERLMALLEKIFTEVDNAAQYIEKIQTRIEEEFPQLVPYIKAAEDKILAWLETQLGEIIDPEEITALLRQLTPYVETLAYEVVAKVIDTYETVRDLKATGKKVILVGMYNPLAGASVTMNGTTVDLDSLFNYLIGAFDIAGIVYAVLADNVTYVSASGAAVDSLGNLNVDEVGSSLDDLAAATDWLQGLQTNVANEEGRAYIAAQIRAAMIATAHNFNTVVYDATCTEGGYTTHICTVCGYTYVDSVVDALGHDWDEGVETTAPTCTVNGETTYTCANCGETKTEVIYAIGHNYVQTVVEATCTTAGYTQYTCSVCGHTYYTGLVQPGAHSYEADVTEPTCTVIGYTTYTCSVCGHSYISNMVPATGHNYSSIVITAPTCTEEGFTTYTCENCGDSYKRDYTPALGHSWNDGEVTTEPTEENCGEKTFTCTVCGATRTEAVSATGHTYTHVVTAPTCTEQGYTTHTCTVCGYRYVDSYVPATDHDWNDGEVTTAQTCTEDGVMTFTCKNCGETKTRPIAAIGHEYTPTVTDPTCTEDGYTTYTCSHCGEFYTADETSAIGHTYVATVTDPTCTAQGFTTHICSACGDSYVDSYVDMIDHTWNEGEVTTEPNGHTNGVKTYTCTVCGATKTEDIPGPGHIFTDIVTEPTCTARGYTTYICACGYSYIGNYVDALGHDWNAGEVTTEPTCTANGEKTFTCTACGETKTVITDALGHDYAVTVVKATCTTAGYTRYTCTVCQHNFITELVQPEHDYTHVVTAPTCTTAGYTTHTCSVCGGSYIDEVRQPLGHSYNTGTVTAPTCTEQGYTTFTCERCGDSYNRNYTPATGHNWNDGEVTQKPTCHVDGVFTYTCTVCGATYTVAIPAGNENCPCMDFTDLAAALKACPDMWWHQAIDYVLENGLMNGMGRNLFCPDLTTTRAMIITTLYRLEGTPAVNGTNIFTDVEDDMWYTDAVIWAYENDIVQGYGKGIFAPDDLATREQIATIFYRYAEYKGMDVSARGDLSHYTDASEISFWALEAMQWANGTGLMIGRSDTTLVPQGETMRSELATLLFRWNTEEFKRMAPIHE